jgi:hypothetical protein
LFFNFFAIQAQSLYKMNLAEKTKDSCRRQKHSILIEKNLVNKIQ